MKACRGLLVLLASYKFLQLSAGQTEIPNTTSLEQTAVPLLQSSSPVKLRPCDNYIETADHRVEIFTFIPKDFEYKLTGYKIDWDMPLEKCYDGIPPPMEVTIMSPVNFQKKKESGHSSVKILRKEVILSKNGYLSVGNTEGSNAKYYSPMDYCLASVQPVGNLTSTKFRLCPLSPKRPVLLKCCPMGMMMGDKGCIANLKKEWALNYFNVTTKQFMPIHTVNPAYESPKFRNRCPGNSDVWQEDNCTLKFHPTTDNRIAFIGERRTWKFLSVQESWCIDQKISFSDPEERTHMVLFHCPKPDAPDETRAIKTYVYMVCMYFGAFFHFLTTLIYLITWKRQNIHGKTLCSCTLSLFFMQFFLGTAHFRGIVGQESNTPFCIANGIAAQYFFIAAFTWLVVVNFNLWRTFRRIRTEGGQDFKRFFRYSAIGWGFPLLVSIVSISLNFSFRCRVSMVLIPDYGVETCFVADWAQGPYLYYILSGLIVFVIIFAGITVYSLYRLKQETEHLRSSQQADDKQNVVLILKLTVVMGLAWVFEVIGWANSEDNTVHWGWMIFDLYNMLSAVLIFIIFVCKRSQLLLLEQTIPALKGLTAAVTRKMSSTFGKETQKYEVENTANTSFGGSRTRNTIGRPDSITSQGSFVVQHSKGKEEAKESGETEDMTKG